MMFNVKMHKDKHVPELDAEFTSLRTAGVYAMDCAKTLLELDLEEISDVPQNISGFVEGPKGNIIWWIFAGVPGGISSTAELKMQSLTPEELEHIEFTIDAILKRREHAQD